MTSADWLQNLAVIASFAALIWLITSGARSDRWRRAWLRLRADRLGMIAGGVISLYLLIGALEMLRIPYSPRAGEAVATEITPTPAPAKGKAPGKSKPETLAPEPAARAGSITLLGWLTRGIAKEKTYSAPLASTSLSIREPEPLTGKHLLGTDALGNDVLVLALRACRTALLIGGLTTAIYIPLGALFGILAGYFRRWVDDLIQYVYTVLYSIPEILFLIAVLVVLGEKSLGKMAFALALTQWIGLARLIRGETLRQAERPYVAAARSLGQTHWQIITRHLLPNVMHLVLIRLVLGFSNLVLAEAMLSYLGVGSPIGTPSWGTMIDGARSELSREPMVWWTLTAATVALFGLVLSLNLFGDALRKAFDPRRS